MRSTSYSGTLQYGSIVLVLLLVLAFSLRIWGVWFGLPHVFHNDEANEVIRALQLGVGQYNFARIAKGGYFYLLFVEYGLLFVALKATGVVNSAVEFGEQFIRDPSAFYLVGRATTAIIGTATVYLVYRLGRMAYSVGAGIFAAGLLTINVLHANVSHFVTVDVPMTFLAVASLFFAIRMVTDGTARDYWWAALLAALATSTKMPAVLLVVPLFIAHCFYVARTGGGGRRYFFSPALWQAAGIFVVAYVITSPGIVLYFEEVFWGFLGKFSGDPDSAFIAEGLDEQAMFASTNLFAYYASAIKDSMTLPVFAVCGAGVAYGLWKRQPADLVLISFAAVVYIVMSVSSHPHQFFPRYVLPALPVAALLGGRLLKDMVQFMPRSKRTPGVVVVALVLGVMPLSEIVADNYLMTQEDTRAMAREWVDANIAGGSKVFIEGSRTLPYEGTVPLRNSAENLQSNMKQYRETEPGKARFLQMAINAQAGKTYDLLTVRYDELRELQYYKDLGVQYFVLRPEIYPGSRLLYGWPKLVAEIQADPDVSLIQRFEPDQKSTPGPLIEIYRVNSNVSGSELAEIPRQDNELP